MLKNMKIKKSLILGFGVTIVISVAIIVASLILMNVQKNQYNNILDRYVAANNMVSKSRIDYNIAARNLRDAVLSGQTGSLDNTAAKITELEQDLQQLTSMYPLKDRTSLDKFTSLANSWIKEAQTIASVARTDQERAAVLIVSDCTPVLNQMADAGNQLDQEISDAEEAIIKQQDLVSNIALGIILAVMVVATIIVLRIALIIIKSITVPAQQVHDALKGFSQGKLDIPVDYHSTSELGEMCDALRSSQQTLVSMIEDECYLLEEMSHGNFNVKSKARDSYVGALSAVLDSIRVINHNLSDTLAQIDLSAEQVAASSEQVSTGAQALAQGATEQASAVEELSATIADISNNAGNNAQNSEKAMEYSQDAGRCLNESSEYMQQMVAAMEKISDSSSEIGKIIDTIENIAFQTNILALNAAVEAARAGSAGKGFAVVADEVRNLASKSDQAAKATKDLIDRSINSVKDGNDIVKKVSESLDATSQRAGLVVAAVEQITKAAAEEAESIAQVTEGIDQISSVVQTNSATSEESAAASEELSSQASLMKELMGKFKLRTQDEGYSGIESKPDYRGVQTEESGMESAGSVFSKY